jgi:hypothetical protein
MFSRSSEPIGNPIGVGAQQQSMPEGARAAGKLLLNPPHKHQQSLEFLVILIAFPEVDELADYLQVSRFIVAIAVDPIQRRQQVLIRIGAVELEGYAGEGATLALKDQQGQLKLLQLRRAHSQFFVFHRPLSELSIGVLDGIFDGKSHRNNRRLKTTQYAPSILSATSAGNRAFNL